MSVNKLGFCVVFVHATIINMQLCLSSGISFQKRWSIFWICVLKEAWLIHIVFRLSLQFLAVIEREKLKINLISNACCKIELHCKQGEVFSAENVEMICIVMKKNASSHKKPRRLSDH